MERTSTLNARDAQWVRDVLERYERPLVAYATRLGADLESARDVVQEAFLRLLSQDLEPLRERVGVWLYTVCRRRVHDELAKASRLATVDAELERGWTAADGDPARALVQGERLRVVAALVAGLPAKQREVVELKFRHGLAYREIVEITGHPIGQVGWLLHEAVKTLRRRMTGRELEEAAEGRS